MGMHSGVKVGGYFEAWVRNPETGEVRDYERTHNLIPTVGENYLLNGATGAGSTSQITSWFIGLLKNYTPVAGSDMSIVGLTANEFTGYDNDRKAWTLDGASTAGSITNSASNAVFVSDADSQTVYGAFIGSTETKLTASGTLLCLLQFTAAKTIQDNEELHIQYTLNMDDDGA